MTFGGKVHLAGNPFISSIFTPYMISERANLVVTYTINYMNLVSVCQKHAASLFGSILLPLESKSEFNSYFWSFGET
jgi:hypothetical protein